MAGLQINQEQIERYRKLLKEKPHATKCKDSWIGSCQWTGLEKEHLFKSLARRSRFRVDLIAIDVGTKTQTQCLEFIDLLDYESSVRRRSVEHPLCHEMSEEFGEIEDVFHRFLMEYQSLVADDKAAMINNLEQTITSDLAFRSAQKNRRWRMKKKGMSEEEIEENLVIDPRNSHELLVGQSLKRILDHDKIAKTTRPKIAEVVKDFLRPLIGLIIACVETRMAFLDIQEKDENHMPEIVTGDVDIALAMIRGTGPKEALNYEKRDHWLGVETDAPPAWGLEDWIVNSKVHTKHHKAQARMLDQYPFSTYQPQALLPLNLPIMKKPFSYHRVYEELLQELDDDAELEDEFEAIDKEYEEDLTRDLLEGVKNKRVRRDSTSPIADVKRPRLDLSAYDQDSDVDDTEDDDARVLAELKQEEASEREEEQKENEDNDDNDREHDYELEMYGEDEIVDSDLDSVEGLDFYARGESPTAVEEDDGAGEQTEDEQGQEEVSRKRLTSGFAIGWIDYGV